MKLNKIVILTFWVSMAILQVKYVFALDGSTLYREKACIACHGENGNQPVMSEYPKISGQNAPYMVAQMKDIKSGSRNNSHSIAMTNVMHMISEDEMNTVAEWLSGLPQ
ncbi:MAG: c-type cytochrome [Candidatus Sedimenticola sp. 20ELBAFRAG]